MVPLKTLIDHCDRLLEVDGFQDYCPNGLQVETDPRRPVRRLVTGVTACLALVEAAAEAGADLLVVHHGFFWKGEPAPLTGMKGRRIATLFRHGINLAAYHLPLDAHPELGNNVQLGRRLGVESIECVTPDGLLWGGVLDRVQPLETFGARVGEVLGRAPLLISGGVHPVRRLAWCTGAADRLIEQAADLGFDAFLSGEVSEPTFHAARERGIHYIAAGHHATERYGVQALGVRLADEFGIEHRFIDVDNPV